MLEHDILIPNLTRKEKIQCKRYKGVTYRSQKVIEVSHHLDGRILNVFFLKSRGVRVIVVGIGPDARKQKYRQVLEDIVGENLFFVDDYASLDDHTNDIMTLICRKYQHLMAYVPLGMKEMSA